MGAGPTGRRGRPVRRPSRSVAVQPTGTGQSAESADSPESADGADGAEAADTGDPT
ncbi:hypothetical protein CZ771_09065 [Actinomycetales bacterium JB111]|nr:hypothetical protein CZ771_09065 [Actinomycetales bacterium JB111]